MRAFLFLAFAFTLGASVMSQQATIADEPKKEDKKDPPKRPFQPNDRDTYSETVTLRRMTSDKKLNNPVKNVRAEWRVLPNGTQAVYTDSFAVHSSVGTEITDKNGVVWVVQKITTGNSYFLNEVKKKEEPKKP